jgi:hypothetical protein
VSGFVVIALFFFGIGLAMRRAVIAYELADFVPAIFWLAISLFIVLMFFSYLAGYGVALWLS